VYICQTTALYIGRDEYDRSLEAMLEVLKRKESGGGTRRIEKARTRLKKESKK